MLKKASSARAASFRALSFMLPNVRVEPRRARRSPRREVAPRRANGTPKATPSGSNAWLGAANFQLNDDIALTWHVRDAHGKAFSDGATVARGLIEA